MHRAQVDNSRARRVDPTEVDDADYADTAETRDDPYNGAWARLTPAELEYCRQHGIVPAPPDYKQHEIRQSEADRETQETAAMRGQIVEDNRQKLRAPEPKAERMYTASEYLNGIRRVVTTCQNAANARGELHAFAIATDLHVIDGTTITELAEKS